MHQNLSQCKLTLQVSRNYRKRRKTDNAKKTCICIVAEKITKLEIASKLHKVRNVSTSTQLKVEDAESGNEDV
jgi:hypothetical protein